MKPKIIIGFLILLCACQKPSENKTLKIEIIKELKIKPKVFMAPNPSSSRLVESDSGQFLFLLNHISKNLQFINLGNGDLVKEIELEYDGPHSMRNASGIASLEKDRFWATFSPHAIGYFNFEGKIQFKKDITPGEVVITYVKSDFHQELHRYQDKVFGMQPLFMDHHGMEKEDILKHSLVYSYDLGTDQTRWYDVYYNEDYWEKGKKISDFSWSRREDKLYISPWYDHEIQVFDMGREMLDKKVEAKSDHINDFYFVNEILWSHEEGLITTLNHDLYGLILYDKYRDCFYRFFYPGLKVEEQFSIEKLWMLNRSRPFTGVMALDKDLNVLGEHVFDKFHVHATSNVFVGEDGLYLSLNNENSPDYDEDHLRYMVVTFNLDK